MMMQTASTLMQLHG